MYTPNDLQRVLLSTAAQRSDGSLLPPLESLATPTARIRRSVTALIKHGYAAEGAGGAACSWRPEEDGHVGVFITDVGRQLIGVEPANPPAPIDQQAPPVAASSEKPPTKSSLVLNLLRRGEGATLSELVAATGWLPHTTRAALTGLRKKGHAITRAARGDATCYRIEQVAA